MATSQKDTIYIDVDDEITAIIDKVSDSSSKIVALVLPKRATALQSIVNMKLLKRSAEDAGKNIVLITSEAGLLPLAGAVGVYTAKTLQSKPEIPAAPSVTDQDQESVAELEDEAELAPAAASNDAVTTATVEPVRASSAKPSTQPKKKSDKSPKIPNFEKFRTKLFIGVALIAVLIIGWYFAVVVAPTSKIVITTNTEDLTTDLEFTADPSATSVSTEDNVVPAKTVETNKEDSETVSATGEKDVGTKATGTVSFSAQQCNSITPPASVGSGSTVTAKGKSFITKSSITFNFDRIEGSCIYYNGSSTGVTAKDPGEGYNLSDANFTVSGRTNVSGTGSTSGGTTKVVKVVSQQDVDNAKGKLDTDDQAISGELEGQLKSQGLLPIKETFAKSNVKTDVSPAVGSEAEEVKVSYSATYSMVGVSYDDLSQLVANEAQADIDTDRQQVQNAGLDQASFKLQDDNDDEYVISMSTIAAIGPKIDTDKLKTDIAGKKKGETEQIIRQFPGVNDVTVSYSPFWVNKSPKNSEKVTIEFQETGQ